MTFKPVTIKPVTFKRRDALKVGGVVLLSASLEGSSKGQTQTVQRPGKTVPVSQNLDAPSLEVVAFSRLAYGPRPQDWTAFQVLEGKTSADKLRVWLERQLDPAKIDDSACEGRLEGMATLKKPLRQLWKEHYLEAPDGDQKYEVIGQPTSQTRLASLLRQTYSERQLLERMVEFWHDHFNVDPGRDERITPTYADYSNVLRSHALGNFGQMLRSVAQHPAMLYYLDNASSNRGGPNENYSRELFELHTMGAENYLGVQPQRSVPGFNEGQPIGYVDEDIYEATRAFTGWRVNDNLGNEDWQQGVGKDGSFLFYASWHDRFQKTVLGRFLPPDAAPVQDGLDVLETLSQHPGTARYLSRKLVRRFVADDPPQDLIDAVAKSWLEHRKSPDQMKHVLRVLILSPQFATTWGRKNKRPLETFVSALRTLQPELKATDDLFWHTDWMGQIPYGWKPPNGYPDVGGAWRSSTHFLRGWQYLLGLAHGWDERWETDVVAQNGGRKRPTEIADFWLERILGHRPPKLRAVLLEVLAEGVNPAEEIKDDNALKDRVKNAVGFLMMSPEFLRK